MLTAQAEKWINDRGITTETARKYGLRSSTDGSEIEIPYLFEGKEVNCKYRSISDKGFRQNKGGQKVVWNYDCLLEDLNEPLFITEGEFDALVLLQHGLKRVISVPDGAPAVELGDNPTTKYDYLETVTRKLSQKSEIVIAADDDQPGYNLLHDLSLRLGKSSCKYLIYPQGCKDLNETLIKYGEKGVQAAINKAKWVDVTGVYRMSELPPAHDAEPHETGISWLLPHYKMRLGDFCVITGVPSHGKSTFCNQLISSAIKRNHWNACFASFEQHPTLDHKRNLRKQFIGHTGQWTIEEMKAADDWIDRHFCFMHPGFDDNVSLDWVLERAAVAVNRFNCQIIVIDPWNEMDHEKPNSMSLTEYTGFAIKQLKKFARNYHVHLIVVAHPAKMRRSDSGDYGIPTLYDISDSAHWYNKADIGIVVHRDDEIATRIRIAKSRYHDKIGKPGDVKVMMSPSTAKYEIYAE